MAWYTLLLGPLVDAVKDYANKKQETKARQAEIEGKLQEKKLEQISQSTDYAQAFRIAQVTNAGWRPGYWTVVLSIPVIMCFVPGLDQYVFRGFESLEKTPEWFQYFLGVAVTSAFGYQVADKAYEWWKAP
jgi:hypothetical protein